MRGAIFGFVSDQMSTGAGELYCGGGGRTPLVCCCETFFFDFSPQITDDYFDEGCVFVTNTSP